MWGEGDTQRQPGNGWHGRAANADVWALPAAGLINQTPDAANMSAAAGPSSTTALPAAAGPLATPPQEQARREAPFQVPLLPACLSNGCCWLFCVSQNLWGYNAIVALFNRR